MRPLRLAPLVVLGACQPGIGPGGSNDLPDIASFADAPGDRFLVDVDDISAGHPFKGPRAADPHDGAHVHFDNSTDRWPAGTAAGDYPAIYAVADGTVSRVDSYFQVGENYRYGIALAFASEDGRTLEFDYSIEPMIDPGDEGFYAPYLLVERGDEVSKGDVIATMYLAPGAAIGSHVHFDLHTADGTFQAPAIFTPEVVAAFQAHFGEFGTDGTTPIPACMGYLLSAEQNPFGTGALDCL